MIRSFRYLILAVLALAVLTVALANRSLVTVRALPEDMALFLGFGGAAEVPLFLVVFGGVVMGLLIGFVWEWAREAKHRGAASRNSREVARLEREIARLRRDRAEPEDEVLALFDKRKAG